MAGEGLYLLRLRKFKDGWSSILEICLYDGGALKGVIVGPRGEDVFEHFGTLADHGIRDGFVYGVLMGMRAGAESDFIPLGAQGDGFAALARPDRGAAA